MNTIIVNSIIIVIITINNIEHDIGSRHLLLLPRHRIVLLMLRESDEADAALLKEHRRRMDAEEQARAANFQVSNCAILW